MEKMKFGSDATFALIGENIGNADSTAMYEDVCGCVYHDAQMLLRNAEIGAEDVEDIIQEVLIKVVTNLVSFYENSKMNRYNEQQRNTWLKRIVKNQLKDFFRRTNRFSATSLESIPVDIAEDRDSYERVLSKVQLYDAIRAVCEIKTAPEKILAFLLNKVSSLSCSSNGKPGSLAARLDGMTIDEVFNITMRRLSAVVEEEVPAEVVRPLRVRVETDKGKVFSLGSREITDATNKIGNKLKTSQ